MPARSRPLSTRQTELIDTVARLTRERGFAPSTAELARELRVHQARAGQLVRLLVFRGLLLREPGVPRSLRLATPADHRAC